ncbi:hypothetical protein RJ639_041622 [Escallonia herrerae]|uniref:ATP-dependent RNA helicase n=1 Tax=Escallonia herrerae TaxID=1293975 RepID=A0AA88WGC4_9ASTE|nr:hypothetical protein RJ639_041622 [Escallonia herrerae]
MPVKLFPRLRLLNPSFPVVPFSTMKPNPTVKPIRVMPVLSQVFPHKLKYQTVSKKLGFPNLAAQEGTQFGVRRLSTRSSRPASGLEVRASKSLIEDEAELSDWVSELRSDSFRKSSYSDDDSGRGRFSSSNRRRDGRDDRGGFSSGKRRRESHSDDNVEGSSWGRGGPASRGRGSMSSRGRGGFSSGGRGNRDSFDSFSQESRGKGRFGGEFRGKDEGFSSQRRESGLRGVSTSSRGRGTRDSFGSSRGEGRYGGPSERKDEGFASRRRDNGSRMDKRGGRGSEVGYGRDRGGGRRVGGGLRNGGKEYARRESIFTDKVGLTARDHETEGEEMSEDDMRKIVHELDSEEVDDDEEGSEEVDNDDDDEGSEEVDDDEDSEDVDAVDGDNVFKSASSLSRLDVKDSPPISSRSSPAASDSYLSETRFDQCSVSPLSLKAIKDAGYEKMTVVQEATLPVILKGKDVLAKAKTGTGKTVAFLLPSIEVVAKSQPVGRDQKRPPILVLVICPTRELASQAATEANTLLKYHTSIGVQVVIGGTRLALEQKRMQANPCQVLVATPGRLKDHIENTAGFATRLMGVKVLVLDEADHLLDMGFRKDIEKIITAVPKQRQTLLFSATVPPEVRQICHIALKRDHEFINTVQEGSEETHSQVRQTHMVAPLEKQFSVLYVLLKEHIADDVDYKVLVFCTTAMVTRLVADLLGELNLNVREIHSRKPQSYRTRVSDEFRKSKGLILVTSDVSARGVDYPDVTFVIQVGLPSDKEQYIHRLGRTGRKGKEGQGILLLAPWEEFFLSTLKGLPITRGQLPMVDPDTKKKVSPSTSSALVLDKQLTPPLTGHTLVEKALSRVEMKNKEAAYQAWLGYYNSNKIVSRDKIRLVELANEFSRSMGLDNPPAIPKLVLGKMGLRNVPGLRSK